MLRLERLSLTCAYRDPVTERLACDQPATHVLFGSSLHDFQEALFCWKHGHELVTKGGE